MHTLRINLVGPAKLIVQLQLPKVCNNCTTRSWGEWDNNFRSMKNHRQLNKAGTVFLKCFCLKEIKVNINTCDEDEMHTVRSMLHTCTSKRIHTWMYMLTVLTAVLLAATRADANISSSRLFLSCCPYLIRRWIRCPNTTPLNLCTVASTLTLTADRSFPDPSFSSFSFWSVFSCIGALLYKEISDAIMHFEGSTGVRICMGVNR